MTIAMIGQKGLPATFGGVERHVHELSVRLVARGHKVTAYSRAWYTGGARRRVDGVRIVHTPSINTKHLDTITHTLFSTIHALWYGYDVIHYHGVGPSLLAWIPRIFSPRTRVISTFHSIDRKHQKWGLLAKLALWIGEWTSCVFAHETIVISKTMKQYVRDVFGRDISHIPNGVPQYVKSQATGELKQWSLKPDQYILMVSRLIPHKGAHYLIRAYQMLAKKNPKLMAEKKLVIVGDGHHTDAYVAWLKKLAHGNPNIVFTGFRSGETLRQLFSHALLMVHPSDNEGLSIGVLEGMSYGLPVLLSDIPEHQELVDDQKFLFTHGDSASLAKKLKMILSQKESVRALSGKRNKKEVAREYNWETITKEIEKTYIRPSAHPKAVLKKTQAVAV